MEEHEWEGDDDEEDERSDGETGVEGHGYINGMFWIEMVALID